MPSFDDVLAQGPHVINLDRSTRRWELFTAQTPVADGTIKPTRFSAVDGRDPEQLQRAMEELGVSQVVPHTATVSSMSPGHTGCGLSHLRLWDMMVRRRMPFLWVMEDDARFCPDFVAEFRRYYEFTPPTWDYIAVGSGNLFPVDTRGARISQTPMACTQCYLVSLEGAMKLLRFARLYGYWFIDRQIHFMQGLERNYHLTHDLGDPYMRMFLDVGNTYRRPFLNAILASAYSWRLQFFTYHRPETSATELVAAGSRAGIAKSHGLVFQSDEEPSETEVPMSKGP